MAESATNKSWQYLTSTIIRDSLIAELSVSDLAVIQETVNSVVIDKIFWEGADDRYSSPYIITSLMTGGDWNSTPAKYADMLWRVAVHATSGAVALRMENAIHEALVDKIPVLTSFTNLSSTAVDESFPITDRYQVQKVSMFTSGGIYRFRLYKE